MELGYKIYMVFMALFLAPILLAPQITMASESMGQLVQDVYHLTCHQIDSRSICFFPATGEYGECAAHGEEVNTGKPIVMYNGLEGFKLPVCSRDIGIYLFAFIGGIAMYFMKKNNDLQTPHPIYFIIALIPVALDGGTQLIGLRESTNLLRLVTGGIAGFAFPFYLVPIMNRLMKK